MIKLTRRGLVAGLGAAIIVPKTAAAGFLINPFSGSSAPAFSYRNTYTNAVNQTNYTFSASDLGTPHALRLIIIGVCTASSNPSAVSGDGTAATLVAESNVGNNALELWQAASTANATGDIVVTVATAASCVIHVWAGYPASTTAVDSAINSGGPVSSLVLTDLAKTSGGFTVLMGSNGGGGTHTWTQNGAETITENYDAETEAVAHTAASHVNTATTTLDDYTDTATSSDTMRVVGATWA